MQTAFVNFKDEPNTKFSLFEVFKDCLSDVIATAMSSEFIGYGYLWALGYHFSVWYLSVVTQPEVPFGLDKM